MPIWIFSRKTEVNSVVKNAQCPKTFVNTGEFARWRERVGIEPTSRLATTSAILKTVRTTRSVRSPGVEKGSLCSSFGIPR